MRTPSAASRLRRGVVAVLAVGGILLAACSPEATRQLGGGPGADPGNHSHPLPQLHGNQQRNNPAFGTPEVGRVPKDAKGVPGFWARPRS